MKARWKVQLGLLPGGWMVITHPRWTSVLSGGKLIAHDHRHSLDNQLFSRLPANTPTLARQQEADLDNHGRKLRAALGLPKSRSAGEIIIPEKKTRVLGIQRLKSFLMKVRAKSETPFKSETPSVLREEEVRQGLMAIRSQLSQLDADLDAIFVRHESIKSRFGSAMITAKQKAGVLFHRLGAGTRREIKSVQRAVAETGERIRQAQGLPKHTEAKKGDRESGSSLKKAMAQRAIQALKVATEGAKKLPLTGRRRRSTRS